MYFRCNSTFGSVGDNVVEPGDIENMDVCVGILFAVLYVLRQCNFRFGGGHIYFRYNATSGDIDVDNTIEPLDHENMGIVVGILSVHVLELEKSQRYFTPH